MNTPMIDLYRGDCLATLRNLPDNSVDSIVTDPPYGLSNTDPAKVQKALTAWIMGARDYVPEGKGFMSQEWDSFVPPPAVWDECFRVLKPGGHMAVFAGSRTQDLMGLSIRLAGFDLRDSVAWLYGSGFPKSLDVGKKLGADWEGWGTALKPGHEPIILARKPFPGTVAGNVQEHGTGALNIDGTRIGTEEKLVRPELRRDDNEVYGKGLGAGVQVEPSAGRWPANVILDEDQAAALDEQSGDKTGAHGRSRGTGTSKGYHGGIPREHEADPGKGGASRFFYVAKAGKKERPSYTDEDGQKVSHPTVKPVALMRWLVRLITPPGGTVLEPFAGTGTTGEAAALEGFACIMIERHEPYLPLIRARMDAVVERIK